MPAVEVCVSSPQMLPCDSQLLLLFGRSRDDPKHFYHEAMINNDKMILNPKSVLVHVVSVYKQRGGVCVCVCQLSNPHPTTHTHLGQPRRCVSRHSSSASPKACAGLHAASLTQLTFHRLHRLTGRQLTASITAAISRLSHWKRVTQSGVIPTAAGRLALAADLTLHRSFLEGYVTGKLGQGLTC